MKRDEAALSAILERAGLLNTGVPETEMKQQLAVMLDAMDIYCERGKSRGDLWKEGGYRDSAHHLKSKAMRVANSVRLGTEEDEGLDSALDAINYAVFFARNLDADRKGDDI
jgi:hypothetical protein